MQPGSATAPIGSAAVINPFINATLKVLSMMASIDAQPSPAYVKRDRQAMGAVTGLLGLAGAGYQGSFSLTFEQRCIDHVILCMLGVPPGDDIQTEDVVGELTNMISGCARAELAERGHALDMALPTIISAPRHVICHVSARPVLVVPFTTGAGAFFVEVCLVRAEIGAEPRS